jgi:hypothetical protein
MNVYLVRMRRAWIYLAVVLAAGLATGFWFVNTEEVDPAATEPGAFDLFLLVFTGAAMVALVSDSGYPLTAVGGNGQPLLFGIASRSLGCGLGDVSMHAPLTSARRWLRRVVS